MDEQAKTQYVADHDLFLIELKDGEQVRYVVAERFLTIDPGEAALGASWAEMMALFRERTLRAVPLPGRRHGVRLEMIGNSGEPGFCSNAGAGVSNIEVNLLKIGKGS